VKQLRLSKFSRAQIPQRAGQRSSLGHVLGENPRRAEMTSASGTNPTRVAKRFGGGLSQHTAPQKHQIGLFDPEKVSFGFGGPGSTEPV
jgi:hypothetical protein